MSNTNCIITHSKGWGFLCFFTKVALLFFIVCQSNTYAQKRSSSTRTDNSNNPMTIGPNLGPVTPVNPNIMDGGTPTPRRKNRGRARKKPDEPSKPKRNLNLPNDINQLFHKALQAKEQNDYAALAAMLAHRRSMIKQGMAQGTNNLIEQWTIDAKYIDNCNDLIRQGQYKKAVEVVKKRWDQRKREELLNGDLGLAIVKASLSALVIEDRYILDRSEMKGILDHVVKNDPMHVEAMVVRAWMVDAKPDEEFFRLESRPSIIERNRRLIPIKQCKDLFESTNGIPSEMNNFVNSVILYSIGASRNPVFDEVNFCEDFFGSNFKMTDRSGSILHVINGYLWQQYQVGGKVHWRCLDMTKQGNWQPYNLYIVCWSGKNDKQYKLRNLYNSLDKKNIITKKPLKEYEGNSLAIYDSTQVLLENIMDMDIFVSKLAHVKNAWNRSRKIYAGQKLYFSEAEMRFVIITQGKNISYSELAGLNTAYLMPIFGVDLMPVFGVLEKERKKDWVGLNFFIDDKGQKYLLSHNQEKIYFTDDFMFMVETPGHSRLYRSMWLSINSKDINSKAEMGLRRPEKFRDFLRSEGRDPRGNLFYARGSYDYTFLDKNGHEIPLFYRRGEFETLREGQIHDFMIPSYQIVPCPLVASAYGLLDPRVARAYDLSNLHLQSYMIKWAKTAANQKNWHLAATLYREMPVDAMSFPYIPSGIPSLKRINEIESVVIKSINDGYKKIETYLEFANILEKMNRQEDAYAMRCGAAASWHLAVVPLLDEFNRFAISYGYGVSNAFLQAKQQVSTQLDRIISPNQSSFSISDILKSWLSASDINLNKSGVIFDPTQHNLNSKNKNANNNIDKWFAEFYEKKPSFEQYLKAKKWLAQNHPDLLIRIPINEFERLVFNCKPLNVQQENIAFLEHFSNFDGAISELYDHILYYVETNQYSQARIMLLTAAFHQRNEAKKYEPESLDYICHSINAISMLWLATASEQFLFGPVRFGTDFVDATINELDNFIRQRMYTTLSQNEVNKYLSHVEDIKYIASRLIESDKYLAQRFYWFEYTGLSVK